MEPTLKGWRKVNKIIIRLLCRMPTREWILYKNQWFVWFLVSLFLHATTLFNLFNPSLSLFHIISFRVEKNHWRHNSYHQNTEGTNIGEMITCDRYNLLLADGAVLSAKHFFFANVTKKRIRARQRQAAIGCVFAGRIKRWIEWERSWLASFWFWKNKLQKQWAVAIEWRGIRNGDHFHSSINPVAVIFCCWQLCPSPVGCFQLFAATKMVPVICL